MYRLLFRAAVLALPAALAPMDAFAHCFAGARFFPATLAIEDPCVADELALPTVARFKNGDDPSARQTDISGEFSKRITDNFGVSVGSTWSHIKAPGMRAVSGFQNLETSLKYQFLTLAPQEFVMSAGVEVEWANTGAKAVGAEPISTITPTLYVGKGFGELPEAMRWAKPFALTGQFGYAMPSRSTTVNVDPATGDVGIEKNPRFFIYGGSLQYSLPYLKSSVVDLGLPDFFNRLIPIVEAQFQKPVANYAGTGIGTTGTINPGVIWVGNYFQLAVEAIIPINRASGSNVGVVAQLHLYLDDIFPTSIGKPIFASSTARGPSFGN